MKKRPSILAVDDDPAHRAMLAALLGGWGYHVEEADDGSAAIEKTRERPFDLVLMDVRMLKVSGIEALEEIMSFNPAVPVIIMTAYSSVENAVVALKKGAYDYLEKPLDFDKLKNIIRRAIERTRPRDETRESDPAPGFDRSRIVGDSPSMIRLLDMAARVAASDATVLIRGESGAGKEVIASAIHDGSPRKNGPFVKINCAALTETLLESELFGHEKGAFTGADRRREGKFVQSEGGSLFLDEVSEMPYPMQAKLLRALQEREVTRVGGDAVIHVDVRVIAAANRDLEDMVREGGFRRDLFYRLNVIALDVPPLRDRRRDIPLLAARFLKELAQKNNRNIQGFTPAAMDVLVRHDWPGNVRELMNAVERGVVLGRGDYLDAGDLFQDFERAPDGDAALTMGEGGGNLKEMERAAIEKALEASGGNKTRAARLLGITRKTLYRKLARHGVEPNS
ncbi:fused DNA-binding response regulator in two-component regulatory system with ZraS: response regulator; sigma54 interaction protein [Candidatus Desulfarcum epimagneticum]|uniref:Fused DNA-binding response regulator in two-component regulatory system with ZraS: response regulator sigma54 interaction protein n=1 Tax=uncultured Desulfobacteraceae bacterium TaxID=218296 RepID=A0A484HP45_9BACT|nr:fused DNA-binding response regulator in two-component regulatory system with ZraS: response regulator; sigma54 interaction protein [uncultured Desulfobacteraceae bacterium]